MSFLETLVMLLAVLAAAWGFYTLAFGADGAQAASPKALARELRELSRPVRRTARFGPLGGWVASLGLGALVADVAGNANVKPLVSRFTRKPFVSGGTNTFGTKRVQFGDLPVEFHGRPVHIEGLEIEVVTRYDKVAATMPGALEGELVLSMLQDVYLRVNGHEYIKGLDGYELYLASVTRKGSMLDAVPSDISDADASDTAVTFRVYVPFTRPLASGSARFDGVIPVACFHGDRNSNNALEFTLGTSCRSFAGVTFDAVTSVTVRAHLVALDDLRVSAWQWSRETIGAVPQLDFVTRGALEALIAGNFLASTPTRVHDHTNQKLTINGQLVWDQENAQGVRRQHLARQGDPSLSADPGDANDVFWLPVVSHHHDENRSKMVRGRVLYEFTTSTFSAGQRFLRMEWLTVTEQLEAALAYAAGAPKDPASARGVTYLAEPAARGKVSELAGVFLDRKLFWRGAPWALVAEKAAQKGAP